MGILSTKKQRPRQRQRVVQDHPIKMTKYYRSGEDVAAPKVKKRRKSRSAMYLRLVDVVGVLAIFCLFAYSLLVSNKPAIVASNNKFNTTGVYRLAASEMMSGLTSRNKISFDERKLVEQLKKKFPEINSVDIELPLLRPEAVIRLNIATPVFILNNSGSLLVVGDSGRAIISAKDFSALAELPVINDETGYRAIVGRQVMSEDAVLFIQNLLAGLKKSGITVQSITLPPKPQELHLRTVDERYFVKFLLSGDSEVEIGQFLAARERFASGEKPAEYLDVRVPGKIYYK